MSDLSCSYVARTRGISGGGNAYVSAVYMCLAILSANQLLLDVVLDHINTHLCSSPTRHPH